jgi:hypothetical protein
MRRVGLLNDLIEDFACLPHSSESRGGGGLGGGGVGGVGGVGAGCGLSATSSSHLPKKEDKVCWNANWRTGWGWGRDVDAIA